MNTIDLNKVRERINYRGEWKPTLPVLGELYHKFLQHVPFENLDIHLQKPINYSAAHVYDKIILAGRGGLCYEINGLFYDILDLLGFNVFMISAEIFKNMPLKNDRYHMHMALAVQLDSELYLVDVGNGKSFGGPVPALTGVPSAGEDGMYLIDVFEDRKALYCHDPEKGLVPRYVFDFLPKTRESFKDACRFIESSPESVFLKGPMASKLENNTRITLTGNRFITTSFQGRFITSLNSYQEYQEILEQRFSIFLTGEHLQFLFGIKNELILK